MKMFSKIPTPVIIVIVGVIFFLFVALVLTLTKKPDDPDIDDPGAAVVSSTGAYDVSGVWYSDQADRYTVTLNEDGSYTGSSWMQEGTYDVQGNTVVFTDFFGGQKTLTLKRSGSDYSLVYEYGASPYAFYRTEQEVDALHQAQQEQEQEDLEMHLMYETALYQILTTGDWVDNLGTTTFSFTETDFTAVYADKKDEEYRIETVCQYEITGFTVENGVYIIKWTLTSSVSGISPNCNMSVSVDGNRYTISSKSFPYARNLSKTVDINFVQPGGISEPTERPTPETKGRLVTDAEIEAAYTAEMRTAVERKIIGTWIGAYDDRYNLHPDASSTWEYIFNSDGTYSFDNRETTEAGAYKIEHTPLDPAFHAILHLSPTSGDNRSIKFSFLGENPTLMEFDFPTNDDPIYTKQ